MAGNVITPNMSLIEPGIGTEPSPTWAQDLNTDISILDSHTHAPGSGIQITPAGININTDLPFNGNGAIGLRSTRYLVEASPLSGGTDLTCISAIGTNGDLYWNDLVGNKIQITASGGVVGTPGSISGLVSPASATWVSATSTFVWKATASLAANMDFATAILRYPGSYPTPSGTNWIALQVPSSISSGYSLTLPGLPGATSFTSLDTSGNFAATIATSHGITAANIASQTITATEIANATITGTQIVSNINLPGNTVQENGQNVVVSAVNSTTSMQTYRGVINANGTNLIGEGYSITHTGGTGSYLVTFNTAFSALPTAVCSVYDAGGYNGNILAIITDVELTSFTVTTGTISPNNVSDVPFSFIVMGPR